MIKDEFLSLLEAKLAALPQEDITRSLDYYREMIEDRIEDGMSEEEAVAQLGDPDKIAEDIIAETPLRTIVREKIRRGRDDKSSRMSAGTIILLILGSPLWIPLLIVAAALVLTLFIVLWSLVFVLYAITLAFGAAAVGSIVLMFTGALGGGFKSVLLCIAAALIFAGLTVLMYFASKYATIGAAKLCRGILRGIKLLFTGKKDKK